jgi:hypothetical protein
MRLLNKRTVTQAVEGHGSQTVPYCLRNRCAVESGGFRASRAASQIAALAMILSCMVFWMGYNRTVKRIADAIAFARFEAMLDLK